MNYVDFFFNIAGALIMGVAIGLERQFHRHPAGLRTNALVCVGAAIFVSLSQLTELEASPTRIAAQVVSGIGFLGAGVIFREGLNVRGMNTAATLWCSGAVGTLAGAGFLGYGMIATLIVVSMHLSLRPVARRVDALLRTSFDVETYYRVQILCELRHEGVLRTILLRHVNSHPRMTVQKISTQDTEQPDRALVVAEIYSVERNDRAMEELLSRINIEPSVLSVSWEKTRNEAE